MFALAAPKQTDFYWTGTKPRNLTKSALGPFKLLRALIKLRRGEYDLLAVHATDYAPWHPRSFLIVLRDWNIRSPLGLFASFAWRFAHLFHRVPIVVIDLRDSCLIGRHNFFLLKRGVAYFKRELPSDHWLTFCKAGYPMFPGLRWRSIKRHVRWVEKLQPISYGAISLGLGQFSPRADAASLEKTADIFFAGSITGNSTVRAHGLQELQALKQEGYLIDVASERISQQEFAKRMSKAWLAWSPGGLGWDCARHYEAAVLGSVPLMNHPTIQRDMPLADGEHCILYSIEPGGLARAARKALADKSRLREMARHAAAHVAAHHTMRARAERVTALVLQRRLDGTRIDRRP